MRGKNPCYTLFFLRGIESWSDEKTHRIAINHKTRIDSHRKQKEESKIQFESNPSTMTNQSLQYKLVRLPYDTVKKAGQVAVWPIHFGKTVATNTVDTMFKVIGTNTEDEPLTGDIGESIYDMAKFQLDIASMIYYYTELRSEIKKSAKALATANKMTVELVDASIPSDLIVLKDACMNVKKCTEKIESPEPTNGVDSLKKYQESIAQLNALAKRFGLDEGDLKAFQTVS